MKTKKKGGIQKGTTASSEKSIELDFNVKSVCKEIAPAFSEHFVFKRRLPKDYWQKYYTEKCGGFEPDGGIWICKKTNKVVAVFEAKHEGRDGNANERCYDNMNTASVLNPECIYYTFATGYIPKWENRKIKSYIEYNKRNQLDTRWQIKKRSFTRDEIHGEVVNSLNEILGKRNSQHIYPKIEKRATLDI